MSLKVLYTDSVPPEVRDLLAPLFERWLWIAPAWCHEIEVSWHEPEEDESDAILAIWPSVEYRRGEIAVFPKWLSETKRSRERAVVHELVHLLVAPMTEFYDDVLDRLTGRQAKLAEYVKAQHAKAFESVVVDMTRVLTEPRRRRKAKS